MKFALAAGAQLAEIAAPLIALLAIYRRDAYLIGLAIWIELLAISWRMRATEDRAAIKRAEEG